MAGKGTPQQKQRDEKRVDELVRAGVAPGKALQMVAEEYYGSVRGDSGASAGGNSVLHGSVNKDQQYASDELVLGNGSDKARFFTGGVSTQEDANNVLGTIRQTLGDSLQADMSYAYASNRLTAKAAAQTAFYNGEVSGIYNVHQATAQRNASFNGFRADLMTQEDWGYTIANQTRQWSQQNATSAMMFVAGVATLPMLAADLLAVGALAGRGAMALGRGVMNTADDMGRSLYASYQATGIRGTLLSAASPTTSWTTVQLGAMTAARSVASRPSALSTADVLHGANSFAWRTPHTVYGAGINATRALMANPNAQAGFVSGVTNTAVDYYINGDQAKLGVSFVGGFIGGAAGSFATQNLVSTIKPFTSGFIGGVVGEFADQYLKHDDPDYIGMLAAGFIGGFATVGVNKLFKVNTTISLTPPNPTQTTGAAMTGGFVGSYANSGWDDWYKNRFQ